MANVTKKVPENVPGDFFVDSTCIDCDTCRQIAPATFGETGEFSFVKMQPQEPAGHFQLATAYNHAGRKADAEREFALYRQTTSEARQTREELSKKLSGKSAPN